MSAAMKISQPEGIKWWRKRKFQQSLIALLFVLPALINFAIFRYYPMIWTARASFWDYSLLGGFKASIGWENYVRMFADKYFWGSLWVTFKFFLMYVPPVVILA